MKKQLKLFATDMDGTFLHSDRTFNHEKLAQVIAQMTDKNLIFAAASGRSLLALTSIFAEYQDQMAFVAENGGVVTYQGKAIFTKKFNLAQTQEIINSLQKAPFSPKKNFLISGLKGAYIPSDADSDYFNSAQLYYPNCQRYQNLAEIDDDFLKITTHFPEKHVRDCERWVSEHISFVRATTTGFRSIDIIPDGISKASGLAHLLAHFGWHPENLAAFGDQMNDYEMLQYAGTAYAVSNAFPDILSIADQVILSNNEDAVLVEIEKILKNN